MDKSQLSNLDIASLQAMNEKQYREIVLLLEQKKLLEDKVAHLESLMVSNESFVIANPSNMLNEELICLKQIEILKKTSEIQELTYEESKKLDTYVKLLKVIRNKNKDDENSLTNTKTEDLMKVLETDVK